VKNRVQEIHLLTEDYTWKYCPTDDNPADLLTRGIPVSQFTNNTLWNNGPSWITRKDKWPVWKQQPREPMDLEEDNKHQSAMTFIHLSCQSQEGMERVINIEKYSKYSTLLRVTAYVRRFISNCKQSSTKITGVLTSTEIEVAEQRWLLACQGSSFVEEITCLKSKVPKRHPLVRQLRLFVDDTGIIRCGGRIHNASVADVTRFPYLLPRQHKLTNLIVQDAHENQLHAGTNATATQIRQKYWIPAIRQCVRSVLRKCVICKRVQGKSYKSVESPPLPRYRIEESPPFSVTGVDLTGALYVRDRTECQTKVYICLFTCASTRAVHLEIVQDLSQDSFMQAFRRFASRRSLPKIVMSDNATNFLGASHQLRRLFESAAVKELLSRKGTEWHFIPKRAPWYGGWWERLIGLTKSALKKVLGRSLVNMETLRTVVTEIEAMLNDRPLTQLSSCSSDLELLTPSLVYGRRITSLPYNDITIDTDSQIGREDVSLYRKRVKQQNEALNQFWKRW